MRPVNRSGLADARRAAALQGSFFKSAQYCATRRPLAVRAQQAKRSQFFLQGLEFFEPVADMADLCADQVVHVGTVRFGRVLELKQCGNFSQRHAGRPAVPDESQALDRAFVVGLVIGLGSHGLGQQAADVHDVHDFQALPGRGVQGRMNGCKLRLGNHRLMHETGLCGPDLEAALAVHESQGRSVTLLADETRVLALFAVADTIKPSSVRAIADLKSLGVASVMLTGDNTRGARAIAAQAGIEDARGDLLPEAKLDAIRQMQQRHGPTGMIGDGINDAPALAPADIGFARGAAGTDTALEAADVVIMNDDLQRVLDTVRLSWRMHATLWQNMTLALGIKSIFLLLAVFGMATMCMAVFADMGASLLVVANGMRLLRGSSQPAPR